MINDTEYKYIKQSILKPYLIHIEFELENIISRIEVDKQLQTIIHKKGYNSTYIKNQLYLGLLSIEKLIKVLNI